MSFCEQGRSGYYPGAALFLLRGGGRNMPQERNDRKSNTELQEKRKNKTGGEEDENDTAEDTGIVRKSCV